MNRIYPHLGSRMLAATLLPLLAIALLTGCSQTAGGGGQKVAGDSLTVFSSLPLSGDYEQIGQSMVKAEKLAVEQSKGKAGDFTINYISLNDADRQSSTSKLAAQNARKAAREGKTVAYIGELGSANTAIAVPILNQDDIVTVAPIATAVGLTKVAPGARAEEPDSYYVSGRRNLVRIAPADDVLANAAASWVKKLKIKSATAVSDDSLVGAGLATQFASQARKQGLTVKQTKGQDQWHGLKSAQAIFYGGPLDQKSAGHLQELARISPRARIFAVVTDGVLPQGFAKKLASAVDSVYLVSPLLDQSKLPKKGRKFVALYRKEFKQDPEPQAVYAYSAYQLLRDSIKRAGKNAADRVRLTEQVLATKDYSSPVGKFSIDQNGDSSLREVSGYRVKGGKLIFDRQLVG